MLKKDRKHKLHMTLTQWLKRKIIYKLVIGKERKLINKVSRRPQRSEGIHTADIWWYK